MVNDNNDKVDRVMALYKKLMNGGLIYKSEEAVLYNVSERTVQRDIDEICDFLERNERNESRDSCDMQTGLKMESSEKNTIYVWWKITKG